jgi:hypothetical protein
MIAPAAVALLSGAALALEVLLVRSLSIVLWHHFAAMVISMALLGYGMSGTVLSLAAPRLERVARPAFATGALAFALAVPASVSLAGALPLNVLELVWHPRQTGYLLLLYILLSLPFACAAVAIGLALTVARRSVGAVYCSDLLGAATGAIAIVGVLFLLPISACLKLTAALAALASLIAMPRPRTTTAAAAVLAVVALWPEQWLMPQPSPYKELSQTLRVPGTAVVAERSGPLGQLTVVESPRVPFRYAPGLALSATQEPPEQLGVFTDASGMTVITRFDGDLAALAFLEGQTSTLALALRPASRVLVLGAGGGADVLMALRFDASRIDAVELNPHLVGLVRGRFAAFAGDLYRHSRVHVHVGEARHFAEVSGELYDVLLISLLDSFSAAAGGLHATADGTLYTVEALGVYLSRLAPGGLLSITRWLNTPPRDGPRLFATAIEALERRGNGEPGRSLAMINGWRTVTVLVRNGPFPADEIAAIRAFAGKHGFDLAYVPGGAIEEAARFHSFARPWLYEAAHALLGPERERFLADYPFDISPTTDDRPYFFRFLKLATLLDILALPRQSGLNMVEWGYPLLLMTLAQAAVASTILILLPLAFLQAERRASTRSAWLFVVLYFTALGLAFLFIEIAFIQRLQLFLGHPIYAVSATLSGFLVFAGLGSAFSRRWIERPCRGAALAVCGIALASLAAVAALDHLLPLVAATGIAVRFAAALMTIAPLAFAMGVPFPLGFTIVQRLSPSLAPWAWGVNGCASVLSPLLASLLAIHAGFSAVLALAIALYAAAAASLTLARRS